MRSGEQGYRVGNEGGIAPRPGSRAPSHQAPSAPGSCVVPGPGDLRVTFLVPSLSPGGVLPSPGPCYLLPPGPPNTLALVCALHLTAPWARLGRAKDAGQRSLLGAQRQGDPGCVTFWAFVPSWRMARLSCIRSQHFLDGSPQLARNLSLSHARRPSRPPPREPAPQLAPRPPPSAGFLSRPERGEEPPPR